MMGGVMGKEKNVNAKHLSGFDFLIYSKLHPQGSIHSISYIVHIVFSSIILHNNEQQ